MLCTGCQCVKALPSSWVSWCSTVCTASHRDTWSPCVSQFRRTPSVVICAQPFVVTWQFPQPGPSVSSSYSFAAAGPSTWNTLPVGLRNQQLSAVSFRHHLKTTVSQSVQYFISTLVTVSKCKSGRTLTGRTYLFTYLLIWNELPQNSTSKAVMSFIKRLRACVKAGGGHCEHLQINCDSLKCQISLFRLISTQAQ